MAIKENKGFMDVEYTKSGNILVGGYNASYVKDKLADIMLPDGDIVRGTLYYYENYTTTGQMWDDGSTFRKLYTYLDFHGKSVEMQMHGCKIKLIKESKLKPNDENMKKSFDSSLL